MSNVQRTLALYRSQGYACAIVERFVPQAKRRLDAFGFIDIIAIKAGKPILAIQTCAAERHADHRQKILEEPRARVWLQAGGAIHLVSWPKRKVKRGGVAFRYEPRREILIEGHMREGSVLLSESTGAEHD